MRGSLGELHPSRAVARRMHELEAELQHARMHLRRYSKSPDTTGRWGLEQPSSPQQEEGWFITYLDMMTLLLVVMIVMLAFSGSLGQRADQTADAVRHEAVAAAPTSDATPAATKPDDTESQIEASPAATATAQQPASTAATTPPAGQTAPETAPVSSAVLTPASPPPPATRHFNGSGLLPAGAGLLPGHGNRPDTAAVSEPYPGWAGIAASAGAPAHPADVGPLPRSATLAAAGNTALSVPGPVSRSASELYPGWSAADLAASFIGPPRPASSAGSGLVADALPNSVMQAPPPPADDHPSEGEMLAADLALGELGSDVEIIVSERTVSFRVNSEILFDSSQADLSRSGLAVLRNIVSVLTRAGYDVTVEGHTDAVPVRRNVRYPSNWELSSARAGSVVRYLQANGIERARLKAVGYADTRPIADNNTPEGRARNRRVELVIEKRH